MWWTNTLRTSAEDLGTLAENEPPTEDALVCHVHSCCESSVLRCFFSNLSSTPTTSFLVLHQSEDPFLTRCVSILVLKMSSKRFTAWRFPGQGDGKASRLSAAVMTRLALHNTVVFHGPVDVLFFYKSCK